MSDHTPEPWQKSYSTDLRQVYVRSKNATIAIFYGPHASKNADRVLAERNACAGIPTEALQRGALERLIMGMGHIAYELGQYADGAEDAHYLAREMANLEAEANAALAPFLKGDTDET